MKLKIITIHNVALHQHASRNESQFSTGCAVRTFLQWLVRKTNHINFMKAQPLKTKYFTPNLKLKLSPHCKINKTLLVVTQQVACRIYMQSIVITIIMLWNTGTVGLVFSEIPSRCTVCNCVHTAEALLIRPIKQVKLFIDTKSSIEADWANINKGYGHNGRCTPQ